MRPTSVFVLAVALAAGALAQSPAPTGPAHALPFASEGNALELAVGGEAAEAAAVEVAEAPTWLAFRALRSDGLRPGDPDSEPVGRLVFDVDAEAPVGAPAEVVLHVVDADGGVLAVRAVRVEVAAPAELSVGPPRPNPAGARAVLDVVVPASSRVRASAYDVLGREVAVLADGPLAPGAHELRLATGGLAAGVYVVRVAVWGAEGGRSVAARRLTVVR